MDNFLHAYCVIVFCRKKMMLLNNILLVVAIVLMVMARYVAQLALIITGRFIVGINTG